MKQSAAAFLFLLGACAATPPVVRRAAAPAVAPAPTAAPRSGDEIIGRNASHLQTLFGTPSGSLSEGTARRLQFAGPSCVLDAYLYPPGAGREPAVTHVDTRRPSGENIDRAMCVAALRVR